MATAGASEHPFGTNESPATGTSPQEAWTRGGPDDDGLGTAQPTAVTYNQIDVKAGLKDGTLTSDEAIVLMEEQMEAKVNARPQGRRRKRGVTKDGLRPP